jgi:hypothetical protein
MGWLSSGGDPCIQTCSLEIGHSPWNMFLPMVAITEHICHDRYSLSAAQTQSHRGSGELTSVSLSRANQANKVDYEIIED